MYLGSGEGAGALRLQQPAGCRAREPGLIL